ncbi:hypothetical protein Tco_1127380, partial [Tanacetum coccineum]
YPRDSPSELEVSQTVIVEEPVLTGNQQHVVVNFLLLTVVGKTSMDLRMDGIYAGSFFISGL